MQIFTQIVLNQAEIEEAVKAYVISQVGVTQNQSVNVELKEPRTSEDEFTANVSLSTDGAGQLQAKVSTTAAPKTRGKKAAAAAEQAAADVKEDETKITESQEAEAAEEQAPWVDADNAADPAGAQTQAETQQAQPNEVPATNALKIFPDANTSAPVMEKQPEPANNGKSLFANLIKPTNH